jgi:hypothetical protein
MAESKVHKVMMYATKIKMKYGCRSSNNLLEIDQIYVVNGREGNFYKKEILHDYLKNNPNTIKVYIYPFPDLIPEISTRGERYVRSSPNYTSNDNLLSLPRE